MTREIPSPARRAFFTVLGARAFSLPRGAARPGLVVEAPHRSPLVPLFGLLKWAPMDGSEAPAALTTRQEAVLLAVCRDYVTTGHEVSSAALIRTHGFSWSSATVRQELATLERLGYLHRSHHSSGRQPTPRGMELYVNRLPEAGPVAPALATAVDLSLGEHTADAERLRAASRVLSEAAGCVAVSFLGGARVGRISEIEVVPFLGDRALVVLSFDDGSTVMRPVEVDGLGGGDDPGAVGRRLREKLRMLCLHRTLPAAREELLLRKGEHEARFDRMFAEALRIGLIVCAGAALDPLWLHVAGQPNLARGLPNENGGQLSDALELLDDYRRLADVLCQLLPGPAAADESLRARVRLGVPVTPAPGANEDALSLTVVGCRLPLPNPDGSTGAVALLGSDRMDYAVVIPLVEYAARTLAAHTGA